VQLRRIVSARDRILRGRREQAGQLMMIVDGKGEAGACVARNCTARLIHPAGGVSFTPLTTGLVMTAPASELLTTSSPHAGKKYLLPRQIHGLVRDHG